MAATSESVNLAAVPAAAPPPGVTPNLEHPKSFGYIYIVTGSMFMALTVPFAFIRTYSKVKYHKQVQVDDCRSLVIMSALYFD